jgi:type I restriction enzyme R subunit
LVNPKYYERMSDLLDALVEARRNAALDYKAYLAKIVELAKQVKSGPATSNYPPSITSAAQQSFYDNLSQDADLAVQLDEAIRHVKKDGWRGNAFKEKEVKKAILQIVQDPAVAELAFDLAVAQRDY